MTAAVDCLINQERLRFGLPPLNVSSELDQSAQDWSDFLARTNRYYHGDVSGRMTAAGYDWSVGGEDIAVGYPTPRDVVAAWMASTGHCQNILFAGFRDMGAGEALGGIDPPMWTVDFGITVNENPLSSDNGPAEGCPYNIPSSPAGSTSSGSSGSSSGTTGPGWPTSPN